MGDEGPERDAMLADSVGLALLVVLEKLEPAERLAFVLHDVFGMTFEEIAAIVDRSVDILADPDRLSRLDLSAIEP